jgi:hypothetical protein
MCLKKGNEDTLCFHWLVEPLVRLRQGEQVAVTALAACRPACQD